MTITLPRLDDDLWRPFDERDVFYQKTQSANKIERLRNQMYEQNFRNCDILSSYDEADRKAIFNQAYQKAVRTTIRISNVLSRGVPDSALRTALRSCVNQSGSFRARAFLYKDNTSAGPLSLTSAVVFGPGNRGALALTPLYHVVRALADGHLTAGERVLGVHEVGATPPKTAVEECIRDVLFNEQRSIPSPVQQLPVPPTPTPAPTPQYVRPQQLWPKEVAYNSLDEPVLDVQRFPFLVQQRQRQEQIEISLNRFVGSLSALSDEERQCYVNSHGVEWVNNKDYELGNGFEARVYMGLLTRPGSEQKSIVAVKQSHSDQNIFNSREMELFEGLRDTPGLVSYHGGFVKHWGPVKFNVLLQEVGLVSLDNLRLCRDVVSYADRYRVSKALCMAVRVLHSTHGIVHRDLRKENVLIMRDGKLRLTDFGLARKLRDDRTSMNTRNRLTTMQPYEVQQKFADDPDGLMNLRVTQAGDIFMLGIVLAFIFNDRPAFASDAAILSRSKPDLGDLEATNYWLYHLLSSMLSHCEDTRPNIDAVLRHPIFSSRSQCFDELLIGRIERVIVADRNPQDSAAFRNLEQMLAPIEVMMQSVPRGERWFEQLPAALFEGDGRLPNMESFRFQSAEGGPDARAYPIPHVAQLVRWLRNVLTHFSSNPSMCHWLRRAKSHRSDGTEGDDAYDTPGDFFFRHPAVNWFLPRVWEEANRLLNEISTERGKLVEEHERLLLRLQDESEAIIDIFA